jgi:hypothetical protein
MIRLRLLLLTGLTICTSVAVAGEADDLQRLIDAAKQNASDLERLDDLKAAREDITLMRVWCDMAWKLRSDDKLDEVRVVYDRIQAQAEMIRQRITASKLMAEAAKRETELQRLHDDIERTKEAIRAATLKKASLEGRGK